MELPEILKQTILFLDDEQIYSLFCKPEWKESVKIVLADNDFWYLRTCYCLGYDVESNNDFNWKRIYYHVSKNSALSKEIDIETFDVLAQNPKIDNNVLYPLSLAISVNENANSVPMLRILFRYIVVESKICRYINLALRAALHNRIDNLRFLLTKFDKISKDDVVELCKQTLRQTFVAMLRLLEVLFEFPIIRDDVDAVTEFLCWLTISPSEGRVIDERNSIFELLTSKMTKHEARISFLVFTHGVRYNQPNLVRYALQDKDLVIPNLACVNSCFEDEKTEILTLLLDDDRIRISQNEGNKMVSLAIMREKKEIIKVLMKHPKISLPSDSSCLLQAIMSFRDKVEMLKLFLENGSVDPTIQENHVAKILIWTGFKEAIMLLLKDPRVSAEANLAKIRKIVEKAGQNWNDYVN